MLDAVIAYFAAVLTDGDELNDWLTHIPHVLRPALLLLGHVVAQLFG
jgi:hypothetical protein